MSFAAGARKVLDPSLPLNRRVTALRECLSHYHPIGFEASFSFLESLAGDLYRDPAALTSALELLTAGHTAWQAELRAYGVLRRQVKQLGYRVPHPLDLNPHRPTHWHGARREAAGHAVWFWYSKGASADIDVHALVAALVERGRFTSVQREMFELVRADRVARFAAVDGTRDFQTYSELRDSLYVLRQMAVVVSNA
ncbi:hypothetical protein [Lentzea aerocolonigenes]|uniref:hypothetical protein n=1 Tax=Lentzea aerocolonigenes TaxID=68170 RepID=UPI000697E2F0|nr:hypothetical protein [Lentzea aerocolonigenes]